VDAATGALLWKVRVEEHPAAVITGAPALYDGRLYVPVFLVRGSHRREPDLRMLQIPGRRDGARCSHGQTDLEELHHPGRASAGSQEQAGHAIVGAIGRGGVVVAHAGSEEARGIRDYRRFLLRSAGAHQRRVRSIRYGYGEDAVVAADDRRRRVHRRRVPQGPIARRPMDRISISARRRAWWICRTASARWWPGRSRAWSVRWIRINRARCCGRRAWAKAARSAECSGAPRRTAKTSMWLSPTSARRWRGGPEPGANKTIFGVYFKADPKAGGGMFALNLATGNAPGTRRLRDAGIRSDAARRNRRR
jgi:hypothetical protein